jgi:hypothetical protein
MDESEPFDDRVWNRRGIWPDDAGGYIFLPRAIEAIENVLYPEPLTAPPQILPDADEKEIVANEDAEEHYEATKILRRSQAMEHFISACRAGRLTCAARPKLGGSFKELERSIWYSELCHHWFRFCDISLKAPYDTEEEEVWSDTKQWLFVKSENLTSVIAPARTMSPPQTVANLSPYMQLMIGVIKDLNITPDNQPNLESLKKEFSQRWKKLRPDDDELSVRLAHGMASLVREPESQAGRSKLRSNAEKKRT